MHSAHGFADVNLTSVFDSLESPVYFDFCRVNHAGNEVVAEHLLAALLHNGLVEHGHAAVQPAAARASAPGSCAAL